MLQATTFRVAVLLAALSAGCTFQTSKANDTNPAGGAGAGAGGSAGDKASGGAGTSGGTGNAGGTGSVVGGAPGNGSWINATGNLANMDSECGNLSSLSAKPDENLLIAGVAKKGLWSSTDGGKTWSLLPGAGTANIINRMTSIAYDPEHPKQFWESGIYNGGGVYQTSDDGQTFTQLGSVTHNDMVSVDFSDPARQTLLAGGHEQAQTLSRSADGGATWAPVGTTLPAGTNCVYPMVIDKMTHLVGCGGYGGGPTGIYRTTDGGSSWNMMTKSGGSLAPLLASDKSIYWASAFNNGITRSTDQGKTWTDVVTGNVVKTIAPVELPDGRVATLSGDYVVVTSDHGATWKPASSQLPYTDAQGLVYSAQEKAFFIWHFTCGFNGPVPVPADAVMRYDFE